MAALITGPGRYIAATVFIFLILNLYLFHRTVRLDPNDVYCETLLHTNKPADPLVTATEPSLPATTTIKQIIPDPVTVTVTSTVTATNIAEKPDTNNNNGNNNNGNTNTDTSPPSNVNTKPSPSFPAKIWQKCGHKGINEQSQGYINGWLEKNPHLRHEVLTDESGDQYVLDHYTDWPEVLNMYMALTVPILKADFLRVLILYADGGIWNDLDVECLIPVADWIPKTMAADMEANPINVVVGIEFDGWQFASWTVMTKPRLEHFRRAIIYIMAQLQQTADKHNVPISQVTKNMCSDVVAVTGPQAITVALLESVGMNIERKIDRNELRQIKEPKLIGDILAMPQAAFAGLQGGHPTDQGPELVSHHYFGSWKNDEGSEEGKPNSHG